MRRHHYHGQIVDEVIGRVLEAYARLDRARADTGRLQQAMQPADIRYLAELEQAHADLPSRANVINPLWLGQRDVLVDQANALAAAYESLNARITTGGGMLPNISPTPAQADQAKPWWDFELPTGVGVGLGGDAIPWVLLGLGVLLLVSSRGRE